MSETGEASAPKKSKALTQKLPYTQRQVESAKKLIQGVREGKFPASKLEKTLAFLDRLVK